MYFQMISETATQSPDTQDLYPPSKTIIPDVTKTSITKTSIADTIPDAKTSVLDTKTSDPDAKTSIPDTKTSIPDTKTSIPDTKTSDPDAKTSIPDTKTSIPDTKTSIPDAKTSVPETEDKPTTPVPVDSNSGSTVLGILDDATSQHGKHVFDQHCDICMGKVAQNSPLVSSTTNAFAGNRWVQFHIYMY